MKSAIWTIIVILVIAWLLGFTMFPDVGGIIHAILVIAVILLIYNLLTGRKV
ncbi:lmo0937 family membrane protein [Euzebyella marina]|uniref:Lmo0937 family membrane protein n=1 Tax=Euzebyella marina TaxID=1761453 RepID=A0A3G2L5K4_9FLAO|nr:MULTISPECIES: lmo0937 family membrane protein [Bacteroidota]AYN67559.1 lmo0937 family membrane protein [Euzebyella marina]MBC7000777.1 lmo0937 family membrane protein [Cytophaga sp. FL35]